LLSFSPLDSHDGFQPLVFHDQQMTVLGSRSFGLAGPDQPDKPMAWQGPLTIATGEKSCDAGVSLVTAVYASLASPYVIVITYSGSSTYVHFVATSTCTTQWNTYKVFTNGVQVRDDRLSVLPACERPSANAASLCSSARVYRLSIDSAPVLLKKESLQLTGEKLGVSFFGQAKVIHPKTPLAEIIH
ncbi:MAG TPA: hypothetical protein VKH40_12015, partial [Alloacidobacterium sp.]|nr:hypothetical protein [Alloacidobacterium sp.]